MKRTSIWKTRNQIQDIIETKVRKNQKENIKKTNMRKILNQKKNMKKINTRKILNQKENIRKTNMRKILKQKKKIAERCIKRTKNV